MGRIIGIDLGTSNSAAAYMGSDSKPEVIPAVEGASVSGKAFPSTVAFTKNGRVIVGEPARRQRLSNPEGTLPQIEHKDGHYQYLYAKRKMGTDFKFRVFDTDYTPQQISAFILQKIKKDAEEYLHDKVDRAVITVPAYFNDNQRQATKDAGDIAGMQVVRIINEPTAASLAYGLDKASKDMKIMVFDLGGGTLDVTIMEMGGGVFHVRSTSGDTQLGGTDMDHLITDFVLADFRRRYGTNILDNIDEREKIKELQTLMSLVETAKIELSGSEITDITWRGMDLEMTRSKLEMVIEPIIERCRHPIKEALEIAKLKPEDIDKIILVGGPTRMPCIKNLVAEVMKKQPERGIDPMEAVAKGAAIEAAILEGNIPTDIVLMDVTPITYGVELVGGVKEALIERNTTIPTKQRKVFTTASDYQPSVTVKVVQGERPMAADCIPVGDILLEIPPAPRGVPQIEVIFDIDPDGILQVNVRDIVTTKQNKLVLTSINKLSKEEIERHKETASRFAESDRKRKEEAEVRNEADQFIHAAEKLLKQDLKGKMKIMQQERLTRRSQKLKDTLASNNIDSIRLKIEELKKELAEISTWMYQSEEYKEDENYNDTWKFFNATTFELFIQHQKPHAYAYISLRPGSKHFPIGVHAVLKEHTPWNERTLVVVFVHELLHALHPDWGHERINPAERLLANKAGFNDALRELERIYLSGRMKPDEEFIPESAHDEALANHRDEECRWMYPFLEKAKQILITYHKDYTAANPKESSANSNPNIYG